MENGTMKRVKGESYLTNAISCSEAETRMVQEMKSYISGEKVYLKGMEPIE